MAAILIKTLMKQNYSYNLNLVIDAIKAGFLIGIGCIAFSVSSNPIVGSFLFSLGLYGIVVNRYLLYTGKIGFLNEEYDYKDLLIILLGNFVGIFILCFLFGRFATLDFSKTIYMSLNKSDESILDCLIRSIGCGILMYLAVISYKNSESKNPLLIIMPIMCFILSGFEHCVANVGYMALSGVFYFKNLIIMILGNSIGSLMLSKFKVSNN